MSPPNVFWQFKQPKKLSQSEIERNYHGRTQIAKMKSVEAGYTIKHSAPFFNRLDLRANLIDVSRMSPGIQH